jgi:hypothetical protein
MTQVTRLPNRNSRTEALGYFKATVKSVVLPNCEIDVDGTIYTASISTHLPYLQHGQKIVALDTGENSGWLIIAAWPMEGQAKPPLEFDASTGTLHIQAARLNLSALAVVELSCGDARIRLSLDGKAHIEGAEIVSSAVGSNRIEGASIDLN